MFTWFKRTQAAQATPVAPRPVTGTFNGMTLADWQASDNHIRWLRDQLNQPMFRDMLAVLSNTRCRAADPTTSPTDAAILLGIRQGCDLMLGTLIDLMPNFPETPVEDVPITYRAEEFDINKAP